MTVPRGVWLAGSVVPLLLANGLWTWPWAAWLALPLLLRFTRGAQTRGFIAALLLLVAVDYVQWRGMIPVPGAGYIAVVAGYGFLQLLPFVADRLLAARLAGVASTLVFPCTWVVTDALTAAFNPFGTWGSLAYTQTGVLPLLQVAAVTGFTGITFLVTWFASTANTLWEHDRHVAKRAALVYGVTMALVLGGGAVRLVEMPTARRVRVASITADWGPANEIWRALRNRPDSESVQRIRGATSELHDTLFARSRRAAQDGAALVLWSEMNGLVLRRDEDGLIERARTLARDERIHFVLALGTITAGAGLMENKLVAIGPDGAMIATYHKSRPVPGDPETGADDSLAVVQTPLGRIALSICFDLDFPDQIRRAGRHAPDLLLAPSKDWREIAGMHARMAVMRAVENGAALIRPAYQGRSIATDSRGRTLGEADFFATPRENVLMAVLPAVGSRTLYPRFGFLFPWLCGAGLVAAVVRGLRVRS